MKLLFAILAVFSLQAQVLTYNARTDLNVANGAAPALGAAGTSTTDPDFHSRVLRVTQSGACGLAAGKSYYPNPGAGWRRTWNTDSTKLLIDDSTSGGSTHYVEFDPVNFTVGSCVEVAPAKLGKWTNFAWTVTNRVYGFAATGGKNLAYWDTASGSATTVFDMTTIPGFTSTTPYLMEGDSQDEWFCTVAASQDSAAATQIGCYNQSTTNTQVLNLGAATSKQNSSTAVALDTLSVAQLANCRIHSIALTKGAPWAYISLNGCSAFPQINGGPPNIMFWELGTNHVTYLPDYLNYASHAAIGWNKAWANSAASQPPCGTYVTAGWKLWFIDSIGTAGSPHWVQIPPCLTTTGFATDTHLSWENNLNDANVNKYPMIVQISRASGSSSTPLEWEIIALDPGQALTAWNSSSFGTAAGGTIWRLAHTYNSPVNSQCAEMAWTSANVSRDGKFVAFSSDWKGKTGSNGTCKSKRRLDVFVVDAVSASGSGNPPQTSQATTIVLRSSANPSKVGEQVVFTAVVNASEGTPGGPVTFMRGQSILGVVALNAGAATFSVSNLRKGTRNIKAIYGGATGFKGSTSGAIPQVIQ